MSDPYLYPGTQVLRNKEDIRDADELTAFERMATANRMETLPDAIRPKVIASFTGTSSRIFLIGQAKTES